VNALCPNCGEADGEVTERTGDAESGVRMDFSCPECDHDWSVTL
jgi:transcriptional regulator NrdR family protein